LQLDPRQRRADTVAGAVAESDHAAERIWRAIQAVIDAAHPG
jgi:hypothetical protein